VLRTGVPKAAVHEHGDPRAGEHQIRPHPNSPGHDRDVDGSANPSRGPRCAPPSPDGCLGLWWRPSPDGLPRPRPRSPTPPAASVAATFLKAIDTTWDIAAEPRISPTNRRRYALSPRPRRGSTAKPVSFESPRKPPTCGVLVDVPAGCSPDQRFNTTTRSPTSRPDGPRRKSRSIDAPAFRGGEPSAQNPKSASIEGNRAAFCH
jgi:hypothetical protein